MEIDIEYSEVDRRRETGVGINVKILVKAVGVAYACVEVDKIQTVSAPFVALGERLGKSTVVCDIETESWYLGAGPGAVGGLNRHSTVEADVSPNKEDYYNGCGDNHHISSYRFAQNVKFAAQNAEKQFNYEVMAQQSVQMPSESFSPSAS